LWWFLLRAVFLGYEAITFSGDGLDESRALGIVFQGLPDFPDRGVDAVLGVDEDIFAPEAVANFLAGDDAALLFGEQEEQFHGDAFES
jgi:hypothetical protein